MVEPHGSAKDLPARQVDAMLLEQGEYAPVELLLRLGHLDYSDYERWRRNEVPTLMDALTGEPQQLRAVLEEAAARCHAHGLQSVTVAYPPWQGSAAAPLRVAADTELAALLATGYRPVPDRSQLDLFVDSARTVAMQALDAALLSGDRDAAARAWQRLTRDRPNEAMGDRLRLLVERLRSPLEGTAEQQLACIREQLEPAATERLGAGARDYLAHHWRALLDATQGMRFDASRPECHASYPAARVGDWQRVRSSILAEPDWRQQPILLARLWQAAEQLRDPDVAIECCCLLCFDHAPQAESALEASLGFMPHYHAFLDVDAPLSVADFPLWYALLRRRLLPEPGPLHPWAARVRAVNTLIDAAGHDPNGPTEIAARKALKAAHPVLFDAYLTQA